MKNINEIKKIKITLPVAIILVSIIIGGFFYGIQVNKQHSIEKQQQIELQAKKEAVQVKEEKTNTVLPQIKTTPVNTTLKIELCKTKAKSYADGLAERSYLEAYEEALNKGDNETAQVYLNLSFGSEHPANYDSNYNSEYIKCLSD